MRKILFAFLCLLLLIPVEAKALTPLEPERECSLTLTYSKDGMAFPELRVNIYRVAEAHADGSFDLITPYSEWPVNIHGITAQQEWKDAASTLASYIAAGEVKPDHVGETNETGVVCFEGLNTGLYLVDGITVENESGTYIFDRFLVYLPTPMENGGFDYDVEARPKCSSFVPKTEYKVVKLWKDSGAISGRPDSVSVEIRRDGTLVETVTLNSANSWAYSWRVSADDKGKWTVAEKAVPSGYTVAVSEKETTFTITNTKKGTSGTPPKTGDIFAIRPWMMLMCLSGSLLLVLGTERARRER